MRRLATLLMALIGAGLALPGATRAGQPSGCPTCGGGIPSAAPSGYGLPQAAGPDTTRHNHPHTRYCPKCQLDRAQREAGPNAMIVRGPEGLAGAPCATCGGAGGAGTLVLGGAPGYAMLGPGTASIVSPEPVPVGVVQAGFRPGAGPAAGAAAMMGGMPGRSPYNPAMPGTIPPPQSPMGGAHRRPSVLGHLFGLDGFGHMGDARRERRLSAHAATRVGNVALNPPSEVPASMVYGR